MFKVPNICVIIAVFLFILCGIAVAEVNDAEPTDNSVGKAAEEKSLDDNLLNDSLKNVADTTKTSLQINLAKQFALAIFFVALLGYGTFYFSKKIVPKLTGSKSRNISITDSVSLGQNKTLHIVEVGAKKLLIGCTSNSINTLGELSATFNEVLETYQEDKNEE